MVKSYTLKRDEAVPDVERSYGIHRRGRWVKNVAGLDAAKAEAERLRAAEPGAKFSVSPDTRGKGWILIPNSWSD